MNQTEYLTVALTDRTAIHGALLQTFLAAGGFKRMRRGLGALMESIGFERALRPYEESRGLGHKARGGLQADAGECDSWHVAGRPDRVYVRCTTVDGEYLTTGQITALALAYQRSVNLPLRKGTRRGRISKPQTAHLRATMLMAKRYLDHALALRAGGLNVLEFELIEARYTTARDDYHAALRARGEI